MSELSKKKCIPCSGDIPPFTEEQIKTFMTKVRNWECKKNDKGHFYLSKDFKFEDFEIIDYQFHPHIPAPVAV